MHDLDPIGVFYQNVRPIFSSNDFSIQLNRDPLRGQRKKLEKPVKRDLVLKLFDLSVNRDLHPV